jgi:hypothetical protein
MTPGPLIAYSQGFTHELIQLAKVDFDQLTLPHLRAIPVYYCEFEGQIRVWPKPSTDVIVCRLEKVEIANAV